MLLRSFAKQASSRTEQNTILTVHYSEDFHFYLKKIKVKKINSGSALLSPHPSPPSPPGPSYQKISSFLTPPPLLPYMLPPDPREGGAADDPHNFGDSSKRLGAPPPWYISSKKILAPSSPLFSLLSRYPRFSILSNKCNPQQGWLTMFGF